MKTKSDIVTNWLPRYTGTPTKDFSKYIILVNFTNYVGLFAQWHDVEVRGLDRPMPNATAHGITILNFGMGSASAATVMDLLSAVRPKAVLFLGKCGGLKKKNKLGDLILPIAAIRGEGTSTDYFPPEVPALPGVLPAKGDLNHDPQSRSRLLDRHGLHDQSPRLGARRRVQEISRAHPLHGNRHGNRDDLHHRIPQRNPDRRAAPRLRSTDGAGRGQDRAQRRSVTLKFMDRHLRIGIDSLSELINNGLTVKHLRF